MVTPHYRRQATKTLNSSYESSSSQGMPLGSRILRPFLIIGLVVVLIVIVRTGVLYPRGQCLASLDMGQEPIEPKDSFQLNHNEKVDM
jgi:hypothetical protein